MKRSQEILTHFQCDQCAKWWSIGDAPSRDIWYCPWCGVKLTTKRNDAYELVANLLQGAIYISRSD